MGCAGSKSVPVVEANTEVLKNGLSGINGTLVHKVEEIAHDVKETVNEAVDDIVDTFKPSTPETQRAGDESEESGVESAETVAAEEEGDAEDGNEMDVVIPDVVDDAAPEEEATSAADESTPAVSDKPPTPMPEAVIMNAQWPNISHESKDKSAGEDKTGITPMDPIEEEGRRLIVPNTDEAAVIEILTIEIAEIPVIDEADLNFEGREKGEGNVEESKSSNNEDEAEKKEENNEVDG